MYVEISSISDPFYAKEISENNLPFFASDLINSRIPATLPPSGGPAEQNTEGIGDHRE